MAGPKPASKTPSPTRAAMRPPKLNVVAWKSNMHYQQPWFNRVLLMKGQIDKKNKKEAEELGYVT